VSQFLVNSSSISGSIRAISRSAWLSGTFYSTTARFSGQFQSFPIPDYFSFDRFRFRFQPIPIPIPTSSDRFRFRFQSVPTDSDSDSNQFQSISRIGTDRNRNRCIPRNFCSFQCDASDTSVASKNPIISEISKIFVISSLWNFYNFCSLIIFFIEYVFLKITEISVISFFGNLNIPILNSYWK
jgi:hypothetical protein